VPARERQRRAQGPARALRRPERPLRGLYQQWIKPIFFLVGKQWLKWNERLAPTSSTPTSPSGASSRSRTHVRRLPHAPRQAHEAAPDARSRAALGRLRGPRGREARRSDPRAPVALLKCPQKSRAIGWIVSPRATSPSTSIGIRSRRVKPRTVLVEMPNPEQTPARRSTSTARATTRASRTAASRTANPTTGARWREALRPRRRAGWSRSARSTSTSTTRSRIGLNPEATSPDDAEECSSAPVADGEGRAEFDVDPTTIKTPAARGGATTRERSTIVLSSVTAARPTRSTRRSTPSGRAARTRSATRHACSSSSTTGSRTRTRASPRAATGSSPAG
jgi:hypothetical protein